jgi:cell division protease FtsH
MERHETGSHVDSGDVASQMGVLMANGIRHLTGTAEAGRGNDRPPAPAGPPPPRWHRWLVPAGIVLTALLLLIPRTASTTAKSFPYSKFLSEVTSGDVTTASVNPSGAINETLKGGDHYTSQIPTAIDDQQLAPTLKARHVNVTGVGAGSALLGDLLAFLPLLLFVAFFIYIGRRNAKQLSGVSWTPFGGPLFRTKWPAGWVSSATPRTRSG